MCFGQKETIKVQFFRLLSALMKLQPLPHVIIETTRSWFIQILHHCSVSWKITPLYFCSSNLVYFGLKEPIKIKLFRLLSGWVKIHQILHVIFETTSQFFFKLCITHQCHERCHHSSVSCTFLLKLYMIWTKGTHQSAKFQTSDSPRKISPNLYFDRFLLSKTYKISVKKRVEDLCLMTLKSAE